jgi:LysM repeat protein
VVYRRRRLVVATLILSVLLGGRAAADLVGSGPLAASDPAPPVLVSERSYVVQPGDTLWTIARHLQPAGDVRRLVDRLATQRHGAALQVGERIELP